MKWLRMCLLVVMLVALAGCADEGNPAQTIEQYLQARIDSDATALRGLTCAAMEGQVEIQANSFAGLDASLQDMACTRSGSDGDAALVSCEGVIFINYGAENSELPLGTYRVVREDGEWKMCGEN